MIPVIVDWESSGAALLYDLLKVPAQEIGNIIGDYLRYIRIKNLESLSHKFHEQKGKNKTTRPIELKLGIPLLNAASLEENDVLQELWVRLLVNAANPDFTSEIRVAFIDIIKTLTPTDAQILRLIYSSVTPQDLAGSSRIEVCINRTKAINDLHIDPLTCDASLDNLERCQLISRPDPMWSETDEDGSVIKILTALGILFIRACISDSDKTSNV